MQPSYKKGLKALAFGWITEYKLDFKDFTVGVEVEVTKNINDVELGLCE